MGNTKKRICFIAQFPPPIHGLSKAVESLYSSVLDQTFVFEKVDIKNNKRFALSLAAIAKSRADLFYFTISQSKGGNLRDLVIMKLLRLQKKKYLVHLHGGGYGHLVEKEMAPWQRKANYRAIGAASGAIVLSASLRSIFDGMLPQDRIFVVPNCVDDEYLMSDEAFAEKRARVQAEPVKHVLYLSNFIRSKGYPDVLEMAKLEKERVENGGERKLHFDFAGKFFEPAEEAFFHGYIREHGLEEYVTYHGIVTGDKKRELLEQCAFFTLLTRHPTEGQPISILEAMGNGMAVVVTAHGGIPDIVCDDNGILVPGDRVDAAEIYQKLLALPHWEEIVGINRREVLEKYRLSYYLDNMKTLFQLL